MQDERPQIRSATPLDVRCAHAKFIQVHPTPVRGQHDDRQQGCNVRAMACTLQSSPSTISRELWRNTLGAAYGSHAAPQSCQARQVAARPATKLDIASLSQMVVRALINRKWSPQQIASHLKASTPISPVASSSPVCAMATAPACPAPVATTGVGISRTW